MVVSARPIDMCHQIICHNYCILPSLAVATHLHTPIGVGKTTPAVYTACQTPCKLTRLVTSLMSTGARRFDRSFLWVTRKLISAVLIVLSSGTGFVDVNESVRTDAGGCQKIGNSLISHPCAQGDTRDECNKLLVARLSHSQMPICDIFRRCQCPGIGRSNYEHGDDAFETEGSTLDN
jgi:hypothetical protein